ncbi:MAG: uroporphyrinogen decarboxylase family protein [Bacillota bacterium]
MNSRDRIIKAINLGEPDRVPFADYVEDQMREKLMGRVNFTDLEFARTIGFDAININHFVAPVFCRRKIVDGHDYILEGLIKSNRDLDLMVFPDPVSGLPYGEAERIIEENREAGLATYAICRFGISGVNYSMGIEALSYAIYENPGLIEKVMDRYVDWNCRVVEKLNNTGVDFIISYDNIAYNSGPLISPQAFREFFVPGMKEISDVCKVPWITHMDGNIMPIMEDILDMGVNGLHPIEPGCMDIKTVKEKYGDRICLWGNIDLRYTLTRGTPEEVDAEVRQKIKEIAPGGGYILGSSNGLPEYCKIDNIWAMSRALKKYGKYPIH